MKTVPLAAVLLAFLLAPPATAQVQPFQVVIDSTTIARSGAVRLSDVLHLAGAGFGFSLDGFRWAVDPGFSATPLFPSWRVRVDGIPLSLGGPFDQHPELLPVTPGLIREVRITTGPGPGALSPGGWIDIETVPPPEGLSTAGLVAAGNEVGDPGPYRYTPESAPNADRIGPVFGIRSAVRADAWWFEGGYRGDEIHMTDPALESRVRLLYRGFYRPRLLLAAPFMALNFDNGASRHRLLVGFNALRDLRFVPATGAEVPSLSRQWFFGAAGRTRLGAGTTLEYSTDARQQDLLPRTDDQSSAFDQILSRWDGEAGLTTGSERASLAVFAGARVRRLDAGPLLTDERTIVPFIRVALGWRPLTDWTHRWTAEAFASDEDPARPRRVRFSGSWAQRLGRPGRSTFDAAVSWIVEMPEAGESPWYWMLHGWRPPSFRKSIEDPASPAGNSVAPFLMDARTGSADLEWTLRLRERTTISLGAFGRLFQGYNLPWWSLDPATADAPRVVSIEEVRTGVGGKLYGGRLRFSAPLGSRSTQRLDLTWHRPVFGSDVTFWQHASARPAFEAAWLFSIEPAPRTSVQMMARYRSRTSWPAVRDAVSASGFATLPSRADLNLTISKSFWGPRARVFATLDHMFDRAFRTHPLGQSDRLTLHVGITARFGFVPRG